MAKHNKQQKKKTYKKIDSVDTNFKGDILRIIKIVVAVLVFFGLFYLLTVYLVNREDSTSDAKDTTSDPTIQYQEILAGSSFDMKQEEYLVLYYDMSDEKLKSSYTELVSLYEANPEYGFIYTVNMGSAFNQAFVSEDTTTSPGDIDELKISGPTLIHFKSGSVVDYIQGYDDIKLFLE